MSRLWRATLLAWLIELAVTLVVLALCALVLDGLSLTGGGLVATALVLRVPGILVTVGWRLTDRGACSSAPRRGLGCSMVLWPYLLLPLAAALADGVSLSSGAWLVTATVLVVTEGVTSMLLGLLLIAPAVAHRRD